MRALALAAALSLAGSSTLHAQRQSWRTLDASHQLRDSSAVTVNVPYAGGKLGVRPGPAQLLYRSHFRYDAAATTPVFSFDAPTRALRVGTQRHNIRFSNDSEKRGKGDLQLELTRAVPVDLAFQLTAVQGDVDLSGLRLSMLRVESSASDVRLHLDTLNAIPMRALDLDVKAANVRATGLANANTREIRVNALAAGAELDFGGEWTQDMELRVDAVLGSVTVQVPSAVGLRVEVSRTAATFEPAGLVKRGDAYYSTNWDSAPYKLHVRADAVLAKLRIDQSER